ncbi:bacteriocin-protection protein, YdeI/OmpD-associated family [Bdellovibrio bacteriovorus]|uniref:Bacteriocin-protection protein, YdeI/OmpD-associated family n=1 Tax=Bdellovibrio bacteriovorus TaxID=959 RepID=A0A150WQC1_BDEBC|nr:YdeI/OmpD-associated family protein [Bdellovibrio bacteriovorus]KYG66507.1 bacteriocin-protection protein, YdeI/OmpD-associated family [Bdellovibrio bacteriovorus]
MAEKKDYQIKSFKDGKQFRQWLLKSHKKAAGLWLRFFNKASGKKTISREEALEEVLCFGWIDGQAKPYDEDSWLQKYTPRRSRSVWSERNTKIVAKLIKSKRMHASGLVEIQKAKEDGRWERTYQSPKDMKVPPDFLKEIKKNKKAYSFFKTLNKTNTFAIAWRLHQSKKEETRKRRIEQFIKMFASGKKIH